MPTRGKRSVGNGAALRARVTRLKQEELKQAEAMFGLCAGIGRTPMQLLLWAIKNAPEARAAKLYSEAAAEFLAKKTKTVSWSQAENYRLATSRFEKCLPEKATLDDVLREGHRVAHVPRRHQKVDVE